MSRREQIMERRINTISLNKIIGQVAMWSLLALQGIIVYLYLELKQEIVTRTKDIESGIVSKIAALEVKVQALDDKKVDMLLFNQSLTTINSNYVLINSKMDEIIKMHMKNGRR